jgi:hypothetical protein
MNLQQGTIDSSFSEIIVASNVNSSKLIVFQNEHYIVYSNDTQIKISKVDGTNTQNLYTGDKLKINHIEITNIGIEILGKNITTSKGFIYPLTFSNGNFSGTIQVVEDEVLNYIDISSGQYLLVNTQQIYLSQIDSSVNVLYIVSSLDSDKIYKDSLYDKENDRLYVHLEIFDTSKNIFELESIIVHNVSTNKTKQSSIIDDISRNIIYIDTIHKNSINYVIVSCQSTISVNESSPNIFSSILPDNTIKMISLSDYSTYKSYTLTNVFIDNIKAIQDISGRITFVGYGYENSGLPLKYLSIPLDVSDNIDLSVEGKGYHFENSITNGYYLTPNGKVEASKDNNTKDIYIVSEASVVSSSNISLLATKFNYPNLQDVLNNVIDGDIINIVDEYGMSKQVVVKKPDVNGDLSITGLTGSNVTSLNYNNLPLNMIVLISDSNFSYIGNGQEQITKFYIKYFDDTGALYDFTTNSPLTATITLQSGHNYTSLTWYDKNVSNNQYEIIDTATPEADGVTFIFDITKNGDTQISGTPGSSGSGGGGGGGGGGSGSIGSDPHVTTLFGKKYDMKHPSSRRWYNLFQKEKLKIEGHFTGLSRGIFFDTVKIKNHNESLTIDFNKKNIKNKSKYKVEDKVSLKDIKYENLTDQKNYAKIFEPPLMTKIHIPDKNTPLDLYIDFKTRYLHFRFPNNVPKEEECSGLLVRKEN